MNAEDNDYLTQVAAGTPMGDYLRSHWVPVMRAARVKTGAAPVRARLFGENYVVFRVADGRVGMVDEACPHRGASLALGRVEGCALRCLFHGWEIDVGGASVHAVSEANGRERGPVLPLRPYPVRETGNMIWAYLGSADVTPRFPDYEWTKADARPQCAIVHCNWVQALEGALDPNHVGYLHPQWIPEFAVTMMQKTSIAYEVEEKPYGFTGAATRSMPGMPSITRVKEYTLPYYSHIPFEPLDEHTVIFAVPMDRETSYLWYLNYEVPDPRPATGEWRVMGIVGLNGKPEGVPDFQYGIDARLKQNPNPDNFRETMPFDREGLWGQDRDAMLKGEHFSGLPGLTTEDVAVMESQGPILDRSKERLTKGDTLIVAMRRMLMKRAEEKAKGIARSDADIDYGSIRARMGFVQEGQTWHDVPTFSWEIPGLGIEKPTGLGIEKPQGLSSEEPVKETG